MKCAITGEEIQTTFLEKLDGTVIKDENGKKYFISAAAQKKFKSKEEILKHLASVA
jgi:hypothetical protein